MHFHCFFFKHLSFFFIFFPNVLFKEQKHGRPKLKKIARDEERISCSNKISSFQNRFSSENQETAHLKSELIQLKEEIKSFKNQKQVTANMILSDLLQKEDRKIIPMKPLHSRWKSEQFFPKLTL